MSGETVIGRSELKAVLKANRAVLDTAAELLSIARESPELETKLRPLISRLVESGTDVNAAMASVGGGHPRAGAG